MEHTTWYELILDTSVLNEQLTKCSTWQKIDLLNRLLYQIYMLNRVTDLPPPVQAIASQKKQDIQAVCLKFASELLWDLESLLDNIQPCLVENLLNYLIRFTRASELAPTSIDVVVDSQLSIQQTALIMWHLWVVLAWVKDALAKAGAKPERQLPLQKLAVTVVSGLTNPVTVLTSNNEMSQTGICREIQNSVAVLTKLSQRSDILAFLLPKTNAFLLSTNNGNVTCSSNEPTPNENGVPTTPFFLDSDFFLVRWSVLRAKIAFVLLRYYLLSSNYQMVTSLHTSLQELFNDLPASNELAEKFIALIDQQLTSNALKLSQAILTKTNPATLIVGAIQRREFERAMETFDSNFAANIPSSFFLEEITKNYDDEQRFNLKLFFAIMAVVECQKPNFVANSCGLALTQSGNGELFGKALDFLAEKWESLEKNQRKSVVDFAEIVALIDPCLFCPVIMSSSLIAYPEFRELGSFIFRVSPAGQNSGGDVEMADQTAKAHDQILVNQVLRSTHLEQLRLAFQLNDIRAAVSALKPSSIDEMMTLLAPNSGAIPRRIVTALSVVTQIPNASFTLAFSVKARQLMDGGAFEDASSLLKEAQELASQMSSKIYNYVSCLYYSCEFERGNVLGLPILFQQASALIKAMLDAGDMETLDSPELVSLYVLMVSAVLNAKMYPSLMRLPLQSPIFLAGQLMGTLHLCLTTQQQQVDGSPSTLPTFGGQQDLKTVAKSLYDIIVQLHLFNEVRGDKGGPGGGTGDKGGLSRQEPPARPSFRDRASLSRGGPTNPGTEGFDDPKWKPHYEIRFWWSLYSRLTDHQQLTYLISCYSKLYAGVKSDLACDVYNPYFNIWPSSVSSQLDTATKSSVGETLHFLLETLAQLAPDMPLTWRFSGDNQTAVNLPGCALGSYCRLFQVASKSFSTDPDPTVVDDGVLRQVIRCFTHLRCPMKVAVVTQFLSDPDYCGAFQSLSEYWSTSTDADDALFSYVFDPVLLEFLINFYETRGCGDDKKTLFVKVAHQMTPDLNPNNAPTVAGRAAVKLAAKLGFFKMCFYEYCCS